VNAVKFKYAGNARANLQRIVEGIEKSTGTEVLILRDANSGNIIYRDRALKQAGGAPPQTLVAAVNQRLTPENISSVKTNPDLSKIDDSTVTDLPGAPTKNVQVAESVKQKVEAITAAAPPSSRSNSGRSVSNGALQMPSTPGEPMQIPIEEYKGPLMIGAHQSTITTSNGVTFADVAIKESADGKVAFYRITGTQQEIEKGIKTLAGKPVESEDIDKVASMVGRRIADIQGAMGTLGQDIAQQLSENDIRNLPQAQQEVARKTKAALQEQKNFFTGQVAVLQELQQKAAVATAVSRGGGRSRRARRAAKRAVSLRHR
jgi:hypothetical protein